MIVRPPWVYGPGDRQTLALFRMAARGFFPAVRGGCMAVSLVHVDDLVEALVLAGTSPRADGRVYYATDGAVAHGRGAGRGAARRLRRGARRPRARLRLPAGRASPARPAAWADRARRRCWAGTRPARGCRTGWVCDDARIRAELGYRPRVALAEGVAATLLWYRRHGWL